MVIAPRPVPEPSSEKRPGATGSTSAVAVPRTAVADLTVTATEKVTRKSLEPSDHERLIQEALAETDFSALVAEGEAERN